MKKFLVLFFSLLPFSVFAFECEMEVFFNAAPCRPINRPWAGEGAQSCTKYSGGVAKVTGDLDNNGKGHATISFKGAKYLMDCHGTFLDGRYPDCNSSSQSGTDAHFHSRYNGDTIYFTGLDGKVYDSDLNKCL